MPQQYLTTSEVATYLRIKERTIYDLVSRKEIPHSRVTGKLLFPRNLIDRWVEAHLEFQDPMLVAPPPIFGGSSDPLLEWALRESGSGLATLIEGSSAGLKRLASGQAMAIGLHLGDDPADMLDEAAADSEHASIFDLIVVRWARREQGIVTRAGNPLRLDSLKAIAEQKARFVGRQAAAGTSVLLAKLLEEEGLDASALNMLPHPALTQTDVAIAVVDGQADCGLAIGAVARRFGLDFVPLRHESFDIACRRREFMEGPLQRLFGFARTQDFRDQAAMLGSYDVSSIGEIVYNR